MDLFHLPPSPVRLLKSDLWEKQGIKLFIKRDDELVVGAEPALCGNKVRKLKYNIREALQSNTASILTFGGAYSNHIAATAVVGKVIGIPTIGVIRGEKQEPLNPTLHYAVASGMQLHYLSREKFRQKDSPEILSELRVQFGPFYLLPEGGTNHLALMGCRELATEIKQDFPDALPNYICLPCGTGGTLAGLILGMRGASHLIGFSALKGNFHQKEINHLLKEESEVILENWEVCLDYHFGGYAKFKPELIHFINQINIKFDLPTDPIYTGKMLFGIFDLLQKRYFREGSTILIIHTGGLQGIKGFNQRFGNLIKQ